MFFPSYNGRVKTADVIVAGGGTIELTAALEMARRPHCWVAKGHGRNWILPAPATGLIVRRLLEGSAPAVELANFELDVEQDVERIGQADFRASDKIRSAAL
jgi:glycine/D-amino acid oxidase-like deaminating enzyme